HTTHNTRANTNLSQKNPSFHGPHGKCETRHLIVNLVHWKLASKHLHYYERMGRGKHGGWGGGVQEEGAGEREREREREREGERRGRERDRWRAICYHAGLASGVAEDRVVQCAHSLSDS